MHIKNLGPIKDASINLSDFNIFIGKNGTGKTVAAYAIYSFAYWLKQLYIPQYFDEDDIKNMILGERNSVNEDELRNYFYEKIPDAFNNIVPQYFKAFFQNKGIFTSESSIKIDKDDVKAFLTLDIRKHGWYFSWNYEGNITQADAGASPIDSNVNNNGQLFNEILSSYNSKTIETRFLVSGVGSMSQLQLKNREDQLNSLKKTLGMKNAKRFINQGIKNILFDCEYVYLPAERIGINVFRPYLNLTRLNKGTQTIDTKSPNENGLERYAQPIESYITFLNNKLKEPSTAAYSNFLFNDSEKVKNFMHQLVPGNFEYNLENDAIHYQLPQSGEMVDFELLSSSLKSIFGLDLFMKHNRVGDWLFCDEPEMNLHPKNQVNVARLLYELVKSGYRSLISTHSDYFVKTIINCGLKDKINKDDFTKKIKVYDFSGNTVKQIDNIFEVDTNVSNFDKTTDEINDEYFSLVDELEDGKE